MADNREYLTRAEENGSINIAEDVVAAIAADAIGEIEGVGSMCQNMTEQITEQFTGIGLPQVKLPASTFYVDDEAFVGNSTIQAVVAPDGLQVIGTRAFADCANLKCITLPDSVSYIAEDAFENTPDVVIFASVGSYAWQWAEKQGIPHGTPYTE